MTNKPMNEVEEATEVTPSSAKRRYTKPILSNLGSLRDLTMTKFSKGAKDGKSNRFTGRGGHASLGNRQS